MGFFNKLFGLNKKEQTGSSKATIPNEVNDLHRFERTIHDLLQEDRYIAKSGYRKIIADFSECTKIYKLFVMGIFWILQSISLDIRRYSLALDYI